MLRTRIAPTPSGYLHHGNALSFLATAALARAAEGSLWLRIDDLDKGRRRRVYLNDLFESLAWLGIRPDRGPGDSDDFLQHYSQHLRLDRYRHVLDQLARTGQVYACNCSRRQIRERSPDGRYPGTCRERGLPLDQPGLAWRVRLPANCQVAFNEWKQGRRQLDLYQAMGDFVVRQKNGLPAYQIASLVDDLDAGINFIVRGEDLTPSTAAQQYLAELLELPSFLQVLFWHHPLLLDEEGYKLSKSEGAEALYRHRRRGPVPTGWYRQVGDWLGLNLRGSGLPELIQMLKPLVPELQGL